MSKLIGENLLKVALAVLLIIVVAIGILWMIGRQRPVSVVAPPAAIPADVQKWKAEAQDAIAERNKAQAEAEQAKKKAAEAAAAAETVQRKNQEIQANSTATAEEKAKAEKDAQEARNAVEAAQKAADDANKKAEDAAKKAEDAAKSHADEIAQLTAGYEAKLKEASEKSADDWATGDRNQQPSTPENSQDAGIQALGQLIGAVLQGWLGGFGTSTEYKDATTAVVSSVLKHQAPTEAQVDRMLSAALSPEDQLHVLDGIRKAMAIAPGMSDELKEKVQEILDKKEQEIKARQSKTTKAKAETDAFLKKYTTKDAFAAAKDAATTELLNIRTNNFGPAGNEEMTNLLRNWNGLDPDYKQVLIEALK